MKRALFLNSHLGSGSRVLCNILESHSRIQNFNQILSYNNPESVLALTSLPHKCHHIGAIYLDEILHNHTITSREIYKLVDSIFLIRNPLETLSEIGPDMGWAQSSRYYQLRLDRLVSIARQSKSGIVLTYEDLNKDSTWDLLNNFLKLRPLIEKVDFTESEIKEIAYEFIHPCQKSYNKNLEILRSFSHLRFPDR